MTPDAATWARKLAEIRREWTRIGFIGTGDDRSDAASEWAFDYADDMLEQFTLHAQAVADAVTDNNLEWLAVARQKEKEAVDVAVRAEREAWESTVPSEWFQMVEDRRTALRARGPQL